MLKHLFTTVIAIFTLTHGAIAAEADGAAKFKDNLRAAITKKDNQKLEELIYSEGSSPADRQRMSSMLRMMLLNGKEVEEISLEPLPSDFDTVLIVRGQKLEPTATPVGMVKVSLKGDGPSPTQSSSAYAIVEGRFLFVGLKSTDLGWKGPPDKNIGFSVVGTGSAELQIHGVWNASGVQLKKTFKERSITFWGQHFEEINVTSGNDDCDVTVTITEDGKDVHSETLKGKGVLQYKKKS
jgi:hypothetical protein